MDLVRLKIVPNEIEAEQVRSVLRLEGIKSVQRLTDFGAGATDGLAGMFGTREVLVNPDDLETARALLVEGE